MAFLAIITLTWVTAIFIWPHCRFVEVKLGTASYTVNFHFSFEEEFSTSTKVTKFDCLSRIPLNDTTPKLGHPVRANRHSSTFWDCSLKFSPDGDKVKSISAWANKSWSSTPSSFVLKIKEPEPVGKIEEAYSRSSQDGYGLVTHSNDRLDSSLYVWGYWEDSEDSSSRKHKISEKMNLSALGLVLVNLL